MNPLDALYCAIEEGLQYEGNEDPGQIAGDTLMTFATERGLDVKTTELYAQAQHLASLADLLTWVLRNEKGPWERPEDIRVGEEPWSSSVFLDGSGLRLRRLILTDRWGEDRARAELHNWRTFGEMTAYELPMIQTVVVIGQQREGRRHSPWSKAWRHPINSALRMRKRSGKAFEGNWEPVWREDTQYSREHWLDCMTEDAVLGDVLFEVEVQPFGFSDASKIRRLMVEKLVQIRETEEMPPPSPSQCDNPISPCQFREACWSFQAPSEKLGFIRSEQ